MFLLVFMIYKNICICPSVLPHINTYAYVFNTPPCWEINHESWVFQHICVHVLATRWDSVATMPPYVSYSQRKNSVLCITCYFFSIAQWSASDLLGGLRQINTRISYLLVVYNNSMCWPICGVGAGSQRAGKQHRSSIQLPWGLVPPRRANKRKSTLNTRSFIRWSEKLAICLPHSAEAHWSSMS
jgi:hypothetical protein